MPDYVDKSAQTTIAGLAKHPVPIPPILVDQSTTPPEDTQDKNLSQPPHNEATLPASMMETANPDASPSMLLRKKRPNLVARISLPPSGLDNTDAPPSPPPTQAVLSPLPANNRLHAGHTPIKPGRSLSPLPPGSDQSRESTPEPEQDASLEGPLMLPALPGDGSEDRIELKALDTVLERIASEQGTYEQTVTESGPSQSADAGGHGSRQGSTDSQVEVVDGVRLKPPRMNMGAPLGQA
ncbi:hypothetical protein K491DRAFT_691256 [Lophiostoma macrostomum CBS 122681]|uniref:Uncharacterized protein n=1 Tax=Lophiostoma macrostomum CBS 122681 TaxID=1314788 RepID=A0A6A6TBS0_9PLEO|nr:hypothetical protein K491DRAFT_691256 [Lophiostoma macrostomum CBS 122681]